MMMALSEQAKANKMKYTNSYKSQNYKRIPLEVRQEVYNAIKEKASAQGKSVNGWIKDTISKELE